MKQSIRSAAVMLSILGVLAFVASCSDDDETPVGPTTSTLNLSFVGLEDFPLTVLATSAKQLFRSVPRILRPRPSSS
jgi:hypothetical protein